MADCTTEMCVWERWSLRWERESENQRGRERQGEYVGPSDDNANSLSGNVPKCPVILRGFVAQRLADKTCEDWRHQLHNTTSSL